MAAKKKLSLDQPRRPRNAEATREAILHSALAAFSRHGYDGIGVREIAQTAGVTAVLVNRYFGSKEELFAAAVELAFADNSMFAGEPTTLAKRLTAAVMTKTETHVEPNDPVLLLLRSAPNPRAAEILRESIARQFARPLRASLRGPKASERAAIILALIAGVLLMRKVIRIKGLTDATPSMLSTLLETLFQLVVGETGIQESETEAASGRR
jgi:AcrR family transcriptional regulator